MSALPKESEKISVEDYLLGEQKSEIRHEYVNGEVFAMAGATAAHDVISGNIFSGLHAAFKGRQCSVYSSDIKVGANASKTYRYPDVSAVCAKPDFVDEPKTAYKNPRSRHKIT